MSFRIYDTETVGTLLWQEDQTVAVASGINNVLLGSGTTTVGTFDVSLFSGDSRWLEMIVGGEVMSPRQRITSVAYSLQVGDAKSDTVGLRFSHLVIRVNLRDWNLRHL